ncbi:MAG: hypothetical protein ABW120_00315 [Sedimenticola sp.]
MSFEDSGEITVAGKVWAFMNYMIECPFETLRDTGEVIFPLAMEFGDGETFPDPSSEAAAQMRIENYKNCLDLPERAVA